MKVHGWSGGGDFDRRDAEKGEVADLGQSADNDPSLKSLKIFSLVSDQGSSTACKSVICVQFGETFF